MLAIDNQLVRSSLPLQKESENSKARKAWGLLIVLFVLYGHIVLNNEALPEHYRSESVPRIPLIVGE
jgi:hypothetical protein